MNINNLFKPKSKDNIVRDLNNLSQEAKDKNLKMASIAGKLDVVKLLIEVGVDINAKDIYGDTALIYASAYNHKEIVEILIEVGADISIKNNIFFTALKYASKKGHKDIVKLLIKAGAK